MKVITEYPVFVKKQGRIVSKYSSLDGGSSSAQIKNFQNWSNKIKGTKLAVDGKWGPKTAAAYKSYGAAYEAAASATANTLSGLFGTDASGGSSATTPGGTDTSGTSKPKGQFINKLKTLWGKAKDSGAVDSAKNALSQKFGGQGQTTTDTTTTTPSVDTTTTTPTSESKFTPNNIAIGVGIVVVLGAVGYFLLRKKK